MLRISVVAEPRNVRLKLEGKLAHEWVSEAENAWIRIAPFNGKKRLIVDLFDVGFVDDAGVLLLARMRQSGAKLTGSGPLISALIEEIESAATEQELMASTEQELEGEAER